MVWRFPRSKGQWNCTANKMVQRFKENGHLIFKSTSALSRGILKQRRGICTIHFNGYFFINTELLFRTVHSVNQLSVHGAFANWCYQFGVTEEDRRTSRFSCGKCLTMVEPTEGELLVSPPTRTPGNRMQGGALSFQNSRSYPKTKALLAIPEGTIIGPVSEVHAKNLDRYCVEVAI